MELIRETEIKPYGKKNMMYGIYRCPVCGKEKEMPKDRGKVAHTCSPECGIKHRNQKREQKVGKKKKSVAKAKTKTKSYQPQECIGCGYWTGEDGCNFSGVHKITRTGYLKGRTCREAGIYTTEKQRVNQKINY